jgi:TetR/AcrR family transcriptional regulator, biofilm operon repressor
LRVKSFRCTFAPKFQNMQDKIINKATEMFLKLGFKSVTMDDIAQEISVSKKTIYKYFANKELLIEEGTTTLHNKIEEGIAKIVSKNHNAIEENFEIRKMFAEMFKIAETSPVFQLKKHYPEIHAKMINRSIEICTKCFRENIEKGIKTGLYRQNLDIDSSIKFYYTLIFNINESIASEKELQKQELIALEYHTRAIASAKGILELEKQLLNYNLK